MPEAVFDVREAAKALAYESPTAAGFHVFRALESVLRRYHSHVTGGSAAPKVRNIGVYLESLRSSNKGDLKVRAVIKQIADLYRNPRGRFDDGGCCWNFWNISKRDGGNAQCIARFAADYDFCLGSFDWTIGVLLGAAIKAALVTRRIGKFSV